MTHESSTNPPQKNIKHYLQWADEGKAGFLRYLFGAILVLLISLLIGQMFSVVGKIFISSESASATIIKTTFFGFVFSFLMLPLVPRLLNKRPWWSIAMPKKLFEKKYLLAGVGVAVITFVVNNIISYLLNPDVFKYAGFNAVNWIPMLFLAAVAFFVQASTEEMTYRGYLTQFVYRFSKHPILFLVIPAFIFSVPHLGNVEGASGFTGLLPYIFLGLSYGWVAYRSGSLWMSAGLHAANNWLITMFVGSASEKIDKVSLFMVHSSSTAKTLIIGTFVQLILVVLVSEIILRKFDLVRPVQLNNLEEK